MTKWKYSICGWIYDPDVGDPQGDAKPGTDFETLPDEYRCPKCGAMKKFFQALD
jgi:rubredoxin